MCEVGVLLILSNSHYYTLKHGPGQGTNNIDERYALSILMEV